MIQSNTEIVAAIEKQTEAIEAQTALLEGIKLKQEARDIRLRWRVGALVVGLWVSFGVAVFLSFSFIGALISIEDILRFRL